MATVKVIELMGSSSASWEDAVKSAVKSASRTLKDVKGVDVIGWTAEIGPHGEIVEYHANCKVAFLVKED
jgi:flavin-binding protein dodecin